MKRIVKWAAVFILGSLIGGAAAGALVDRFHRGQMTKMYAWSVGSDALLAQQLRQGLAHIILEGADRRLIDVYPEQYEPDPKMGGYQLLIAGDVFRGRYLKSFEKSQPIPANTVQHYQIPFPANDHTFKKGDRIMVQVQSTWFPVSDRNPQRFVPNIFLAKESDFQLVTQRIYRSGRYASHIAVPVVTTAK